MPASTVSHGTGTVVTFGTTTYAGKLLSVEWSGISRPSLAVTNMSTAVAVPANNFGDALFVPGLYVDPGELGLEFQFDPDQEFPNLHTITAGTVRVTFPLIGSGTAAYFQAAAGFWTGVEISIPMEEIMTVSITVKLSGLVTYQNVV